MKIGLLLSSPPGYSETFFTSKIKGLQAHGHSVLLITAATSQQFAGCKHKIHPRVAKSVGMQLVRFLLVGITLLPYLQRVIRYIKLERNEGTSLKRAIEKTYLNATLLKLDVDWLHFGFATMAIDRELVAKAIGAKMAVSFRGFDITTYPLKHANAYYLLWKRVDKVHSISKFLLAKAYTLGLSKETPYQIITPAVSIQSTSQQSKTKTNKPIQLITVARLHYIKGIDTLLQTASILKKNKIDFIWKVVGTGSQKDTERYLYHRYQLKLEEDVLFIGKQSHQDTLQAIAQSDLYIQTSIMEGFCNAVLEAQAFGTISIAFNTGGLPENISDSKTGFLVEEISADALASKIMSVLSFKPEEKCIITKQAQNRVRKEFTIEKQQQEFVVFYQK